jgi:hypothetical protein
MTFLRLPSGLVVNTDHVCALGHPRVHHEGEHRYDVAFHEGLIDLDQDDSRAFDAWIDGEWHGQVQYMVRELRDAIGDADADFGRMLRGIRAMRERLEQIDRAAEGADEENQA